MRAERLFASFFMGGFECSTHVTIEGHRLDVIAATQHDKLAREDYRLCRSAGIRVVREAARWPLIDRAGRLDLAGPQELARIGREEGVGQIWDLMHYGFPDDLDPLTPTFRERFVAYARAVAQVIRQETDGLIAFTPINEISYYAWAGGDVGYMAPFGHGRGGELKRALVQSAIAATDAIWEVDPTARILTVDPLVRVHPPEGRPDLQARANDYNDHVVNEAFDMLAGRLAPELGGSRAHLGIVGLNYYAGNQWTIATTDQPQRFLSIEDPAWIRLPDLLEELEGRYGGPLVIAETGASGTGRPAWLAYLTREAKRALDRGIDLQGVCLYPVVTSPDWEDPTAFFDGGLFDVVPRPDGMLERILALPVAEALREAQASIDPENLPRAELPAEAPPAEIPEFAVISPLTQARFKADNFSYQTVVAGEFLQVEVYGLQPGAGIPPHRHFATEHVLTVAEGQAEVLIADTRHRLHQGESLLVPAGFYYGVHNPGTGRLVIQQISGPKPWDARFGGPHPSQLTGKMKGETSLPWGKKEAQSV
jgi:quercetin dioxygenase-like cupin family protein